MNDTEKIKEIVKAIYNLSVIPNHFTGKGFRPTKGTSRNAVYMAMYVVMGILTDEIEVQRQEDYNKWVENIKPVVIARWNVNTDTLEMEKIE